MKRFVRHVVIAEREDDLDVADAECVLCGQPVFAEIPVNYPQVCHDCADEWVWHYCDRPVRTAPKGPTAA